MRYDRIQTGRQLAEELEQPLLPFNSPEMILGVAESVSSPATVIFITVCKRHGTWSPIKTGG